MVSRYLIFCTSCPRCFFFCTASLIRKCFPLTHYFSFKLYIIFNKKRDIEFSNSCPVTQAIPLVHLFGLLLRIISLPILRKILPAVVAKHHYNQEDSFISTSPESQPQTHHRPSASGWLHPAQLSELPQQP